MTQDVKEFVRPASLPMPTVWSRFRGLKPMPDGKTPDFWVQCIRPEDDDAVVELMAKHFLSDEETCRALQILEFPDAVEELRAMWREILTRRLSLAAWTTWPDGVPHLIGCNILYVAKKNSPKFEGRTAVTRKSFRSMYALMARVDPFALFACEEYLSAMGLCVVPALRGQGVGGGLLRARAPLARSLGLTATLNIFSGAPVQALAARVGFKTFAEMRYLDYEDEGEVVYKDVKGAEAMLVMGWEIPSEGQGACEFVRPSSLAMPTVWSRFRGSRAMGDGRVPDFWVQCVRPEDDDAVVAIMEKHFLREEETSRAVKLLQHPDAVAEIRAVWRKLLQQRVSLAAWTGWPDGTPRLVGCNVLFVAHKNDPKEESKSPLNRRINRSMSGLMERADPFSAFGCDAYLSAYGLSVLPEFRGQALGLELLKARVPLCRALALKATATVFTGVASQKLAARAGFKTMAQLRYKDYVDEGEVVFKDVIGAEVMEIKGLAISKDSLSDGQL